MEIEGVFLKNSEASIAVILLITARAAGMSFAVVSWGRFLNNSTKIAISIAAISYSLSEFSLNLNSLSLVKLGGYQFFFFLILNVLVGALISFLPVIFYEIFKHVAIFVDGLRGARISSYFNPDSGESISSLENLFSLMAITLFFHSGLCQLWFSLFRKSFEILPYNFQQSSIGSEAISKMLNFKLALFPLDIAFKHILILILLFMIFELSLLLISHLLPNLPSFFEFMSFRLFLGIALIYFFSIYSLDGLKNSIDNFISITEKKFSISD